MKDEKNLLIGAGLCTGSAKSCIIDDEANVLAYTNREYPIITLHPGWSEHDASRYWEIACELIRESIRKSGVSAEDIAAIAVSSALPSMVMIDKDGNSVNNAYNLMDRRAVPQVAMIKQKIGEKQVFDLTGNRLEDHPSLINLLWEKDNRPESYERIHKVLTIDGYISFKLTGRSTVNYSAAAFYGIAYDIRKKEFNEEMLKTIGIDKAILPELCGCDEVIGTVSHNASSESGLATKTMVAGGQVDCNAGWVGAGAVEPGDIQMNLGTCGNFGIIHKDDKFIDSMIAFPYTVNAKETNITVPTTTTGGQALRYIRDNFSHAERAAESLSGMDTYEMLNVQARKLHRVAKAWLFFRT